MLPVCSATPCCSHSPVSLDDKLRNFSRSQKIFEVRCIVGDTVVPGLSNVVHLPRLSVRTQAMNSLYYNCVEMPEPFCRNGEYLVYVENSSTIASEEELVTLMDYLTKNTDVLLQHIDSETLSTLDDISDSNAAVPDSLSTRTISLPNFGNFENFLSDMIESIGTSVGKGGSAIYSSLDRVVSSLRATVGGTDKTVDNLVSNVLSSVDQTGELSRNKLMSLLNEFIEGSGKAGVIALNLLRQTLIAVEDSLAKGTRFISYSYGSIKELLPPEIRDVLNLSEDRAREISRPIGMALQQVYAAIEGWNRSLGLDLSDPIIPFVFIVGVSSTFWVVYWLATYGGYAGDLSPNLVFKLLSGEESTMLVDVRPEDMRERDGIPDLRRAARFRYSHVSIPEVDGSTRKLLKSGRDLDDSLMAIVIQNLKNVGDRSKIIILDADGTRSKGIARALRKLGIERSYRVEGGFQSWVRQGLRIKELKPDTALTLLNEEAEAILEDLSPNPLQLFGIGVGSIAALYALLEWEKTLQLIGIIGLGQTIYRRVASYEDNEDLKKDVRLLLAPITLGAQAVSWAARKLEINGNGLPISPSSTDVQNRAAGCCKT
ncbi:hypothetical protein Nepgr_017924 [Nepenthes gracilis]|uniref:Rhodanese domain-containing protein n=1 Tax=Nepenthes gracilis TaxID=150966 RepID=A0AAD3SQA8_NEPGR|nr:hypothetical protein Nepgr_017924 [Nepenthes gracilis]